jgi:hypothetical protein
MALTSTSRDAVWMRRVYPQLWRLPKAAIVVVDIMVDNNYSTSIKHHKPEIGVVNIIYNHPCASVSATVCI